MKHQMKVSFVKNKDKIGLTQFALKITIHSDMFFPALWMFTPYVLCGPLFHTNNQTSLTVQVPTLEVSVVTRLKDGWSWVWNPSRGKVVVIVVVVVVIVVVENILLLQMSLQQKQKDHDTVYHQPTYP